MKKNKKRLYRKVRAVLGEFTPLRGDCGALCGRACCRGDAQTGMLLFPKEQTPLRVIERGGRRLAVCEGRCRRNERPLACRIFPFLPRQTERGVVVLPDQRGYGVCPLVRRADDVAFRQRFLHRVRKAGKLLYADRDCRDFLREAAAQADETVKFREIFAK